MLVISNDSQDKLCGERVWKNNGFFQDLRPDLSLEKKNIPENTLFYVNQSLLSTVKNEDIAMYNHNFILGHLIVAANQPSDINVTNVKKMKLSYAVIFTTWPQENFRVLENSLHTSFWEETKKFSFLTVLAQLNQKFFILIQRIRFQMCLFLPPLKTIILKSVLKKELMKIHLHFSFFFRPSQIEKNQ